MSNENIMFKLVIIALIFAPKVNTFLSSSFDNSLKCPDTTTCSCYLARNEVEIECPLPLPQISMRIQPSSHISIECSNLEESDYEIIPTMDVGNVSKVKIRGCPLPTGQPIKSILRNFGNFSMKSLVFQSPNTQSNSDLNRKHFFGLEDLERLTLKENGFSELPEDLFNDLTNLIYLDLKSNQLNLNPKIFENFKKLEFLELGYNNIQFLNKGVFKNQNRLKLLNLWSNNLTILTKESFEGISSLVELDLSSNFIETFKSDVFSGLPNLVNLNLNANHFKSLPEKLFEKNKKLLRLRLMNNRVPLETLPSGLFSNLHELEDVSIKCGLSTVPEDLFQGSSNITHINFDNNNLTTLPDRLFADQKNLLQLNLNRNNLKNLPNGLFAGTSSLTVLKLSYNQLVNISGSIFLHLTSLTELYLNDNNLHHINRNSFTSLVSLEKVDLQNNHLTLYDDFTIESMEIEAISPFNSLTSLKKLNLRNNSISVIFPDWTTSLLELQLLDLSFNKIKMISTENLQFLSTKLDVILTNNEIFEVDLKELESTALSQDEMNKEMNVNIFLDNNPINCNCAILHFNKFLRNELAAETKKIMKIVPGNLKCVKPVNLVDKLVIKVQPKELLCSLDSPQSLKKRCPNECSCKVRPEDKALLVDCSNSNLTEIPDLPNSVLHQFLSTELNISNNQIRELPIITSLSFMNVKVILAGNNNISKIGLEHISEHLNILDLSNNNLEEINLSILEKLNKTQELHGLKLSGNPWKCDCEHLDILPFVLAKFKIIQDLKEVRCSNGDAIFQLSAGDFCSEDAFHIIVISCVCTFVILILVGVIFTVHYKQEIKVWLYAHNMCLWFVTEEVLDKDKRFDAFISYSHKDENFVTNHLLPELENGPHPYKLCLHNRDWLVGEFIPTQIATSVNDSRRTIVVLSPNFLESVWARMEFRAAHQKALDDGRARVIVVIYEDIGNIEYLDDELKCYLKTNTYVKWDDPLFWNKLRYAMPHTSGTMGTDEVDGISVGQNDNVIENLNATNGKLSAGVNGSFVISDV